jgi:hypothetical protein
MKIKYSGSIGSTTNKIQRQIMGSMIQLQNNTLEFFRDKSTNISSN